MEKKSKQGTHYINEVSISVCRRCPDNMKWSKPVVYESYRQFENVVGHWAKSKGISLEDERYFNVQFIILVP